MIYFVSLYSIKEWGHPVFIFLILISLGMMPSSSIQAVTNFNILSFLLYLYTISIFKHLGYLHILVIVLSALMNVYISFWINIFMFFGSISEISESYKSSILTWDVSNYFSYRLNQTIFPPTEKEGSFSPISCQFWSFSFP